MNRLLLFGVGLVFAASPMASVAVAVLLGVCLVWWPHMLWQARQQNAALRGENQEHLEKIQALELQLAEARKSNGQLRRQLAEAVPYVEAYQQVCQENGDLRGQVEVLSQQVEVLSQQVEVLSQQVAEQEGDLAVYEEIRQLVWVEIE